MQRDATHREQPPSWVGPATAALVILILIGLIVLVWITVFDAGDEAHVEEATRHVLNAIVSARSA